MGALAGKRVLVTRAAEQSSALADLLRGHGATPIVAPTIEIAPPPDAAAIDSAIGSLRNYDWIAFTSGTAVARFVAELAARGVGKGAVAGAKIAAVGPGTGAALSKHGLDVECVADEHLGEGLATALLERTSAGQRILLPRALVARDVLPQALREAGRIADVLVVYETRKPSAESFASVASAFSERAIDAVTLTSSSTALNLIELLGARAKELLTPCVVASIGPVTTETAEGLGVRVDATASPHTLPALVAALEAVFDGKSPGPDPR